MSGLPRVPSTLRPRFVWEHLVLGGVERMTSQVMSGAEVSETDLRDMEALVQRAEALGNAIAARKRAAGIVDDVLED